MLKYTRTAVEKLSMGWDLVNFEIEMGIIISTLVVFLKTSSCIKKGINMLLTKGYKSLMIPAISAYWLAF
jgi:hypothetical protein